MRTGRHALLRMRAGDVLTLTRIWILHMRDGACDGLPPYTCGRANPVTRFKLVLARQEGCGGRVQRPSGAFAEASLRCSFDSSEIDSRRANNLKPGAGRMMR
jgi:hypothetical protein